VANVPSTVIHRPRARRPKEQDWLRKVDLDRAQLKDNRLRQTVRAAELGARIDATAAEITLTIDPTLEQRARLILSRNAVPYGAVVLVELKSNRILAISTFSAAQPSWDKERLALTPWAPAASVFKIISTAALLERGVPASTTACYHGGMRGLRPHHLVDNPRRDYLCSTLSDGIAKSINPVIGKLATRYLRPAQLQEMAERFGFNGALELPLTHHQSRAVIPTPRLELARVAAGFWQTKLSAMHGAVIASVVATDGVLRWPRIVESIREDRSQPTVPALPPTRRVIASTTARALKAMMHRTTTHGTGRRGFLVRRGRERYPHFPVAGKTGSLSKGELHYSWFVGFAPMRQPEIAFAVVLGNSPLWRIKASTAASLLVNEYLIWKKAKNSPRKLAAAMSHRPATVSASAPSSRVDGQALVGPQPGPSFRTE
jgi:cell division protein FtsI/penicillin-binding protein 2